VDYRGAYPPHGRRDTPLAFSCGGTSICRRNAAEYGGASMDTIRFNSANGVEAMNEEIHGGIIRISADAGYEMFADVLSIDSTNIQGVLRDKGVFAEVRTRLLLP